MSHYNVSRQPLIPPKLDGLLTINEVAAQLRVDPTTVRRWIKTGVLQAVLLPTKSRRHAYRIRQSTYDAIMEGGQPE